MRRAAWLVAILGLGLLGGSPVTRAAVGDNNVGMNVHDGRAPFVDACVDLGVTWVRMDANWVDLEPSSDDNYQFGTLSTNVSDAIASGLQVYLTLAYTPSWVPRHGDTDGRSHNDIPNTSTEWVDFVTDAVTHFSGLGVTHFGIWNEPNLSSFLEGEHSNLNDYVNIILVPGAAAVRSACPTCKVLGPDLANVGEVDVYLKDLLALIPTNTFDIFAHHIYQGFPQTGVQEYDGDRFFNVLDQQRFYGTPLALFTRRSLRDLLDEWGWAGEVWITETGYEAEPPGNTTEEATQAVYLPLVLEEQLLRDWYTNSFFYEILDCGPDQPTCTIDGFGLMRAQSGTPGSRTFPSDFRLKPAFHALKQFITDHPEIVSSGTVTHAQCSDGSDNDGDGFADLADRGCIEALDDNEADDPPRRAIQAPPAGAITVDGTLSDFGDDGWVTLGTNDWRSPEPLGPGDLEVSAAARWSSAGLYLAFRVTDDVHQNTESDATLWQGDSVQAAFDVAQSAGPAYDDVDDHEINFALANDQARAYRFHGPDGASDAFEVAIVRGGSVTLYEIFLPAATLPSATFALGEVLGFSFLVNDADGAGRVGWIELTPGIGSAKVPYYFGEVRLVQEVVVLPDGGVPDGGLVPDGGSVGDGGVVSDAAYSADGTVGADGAGSEEGDGGGCGCRLGPLRAPASAGLLLATLLLVLGRRRR